MSESKSKAITVKREKWMRDSDYRGYVKREAHEPARKRLESKGHTGLGISESGLYKHNPKTGFNEGVHKRTGKFTGKFRT